MRIIKATDYNDMSKKAADVLAEIVKEKPDLVMGLATGSSPVGMYKCLIEKYENKEIDFSKARSVNLDEYLGLSGDHDQSYRYFMDTNFFNHVNIDKKNTHVPDGVASDPEKNCADYDKIIESLGGVDVQVLGMGHNGHIGFNEPGDHFTKTTHLIELQESTRHANGVNFEKEEDMPHQAYTMGIQNIMQSKKIILIVSGKAKAEILKLALTGNVTPHVPGSILQFHRDVTVVADAEAMSVF
ncbi:MAG: glucosamine-6-phosphate deaminase [Bacillota bacterium]